MQKRNMTTFQFFCEIFKRYPYEMVLITTLLLISSFFEVVSLASILPLLSSFFNGIKVTDGFLGRFISYLGLNDMSVFLLLLIIIGFSLISTAALFFKDIIIARLQFSMQRMLRGELMEKLMFAKWPFHLEQKTGTLVNVIFSETQRISASVRQLGVYYSNLLIVGVYFLFSLFVLWKAVFIVAVAAIVASPVIVKLQVLSRSIGWKGVFASNKCNALIVENLMLNKFIKAGTLEGRRMSIFQDSTAEVSSYQFKQGLYKAIMEHGSKVLLVVLVCSVFYVFKENPNYSSVSLFFLLMLVQRAFSRFIVLQVGKRALIGAIPGFEFTLSLMNEAQVAREKCVGEEYQGLRGRIRFENVSFSYLEDQDVLKGVDLFFEKNQITALVGPSGSGKSTIVHLLLGLIAPGQGRIIFDESDMKDIDVRSFRQHLGYIPQDPILLNGTIRENIAIASPEASEESIVNAAKLAHAHEFILKQKWGYDTLVGDRGIKLSGGQKQRIALARALLIHPEILILDEATSALDNESESKIQETINALKGLMTIIIVAHRLSTVEKSDKIYFLKNGKILESGTMDELKKKDGEFLKMYNLSLE